MNTTSQIQLALTNLALATNHLEMVVLQTERIKDLQDDSIMLSCDPNLSPTIVRLSIELNHEKIEAARLKKNEAIAGHVQCIRELFEQGSRDNARAIGNLIVLPDGTVQSY